MSIVSSLRFFIIEQSPLYMTTMLEGGNYFMTISEVIHG